MSTGALSGLPTMATAAQSGTKASGSAGDGPFNILFILTDQHIQQMGVFDNLDFPWASELPSDMPTVGSYMADAGYYSAYLG